MDIENQENLINYKDLVNEKLSEFVLNFRDAPKRTKELVHFQSVINISQEIIQLNNCEADALKNLILEYFDIVREIDYSNDTYINDIHDKKKKSLNLYHKYIIPVGKYLVKERRLRPDLPLGMSLIFGIILDIVIYYFISKNLIPLITILIFILALIVKDKRRKNGNFFAPYI